MNFLQRRRWRKRLRHLLKEARHIRNLREDIADPKLLSELNQAATAVEQVLKQRAYGEMGSAATALETAMRQMSPPRPAAALRENLEVILVAVAVAMAFRTYFIQPFKIPTSSMSPTLSGITYIPQERRTLADQFPVNLFKWLVWGEWYVEARARVSGPVRVVQALDERVILVGNVPHAIGKGMSLRVADGDFVVKGQLLASGCRVAGDHIFVDKISWNFRQPRRSEIMVFKTTNIKHPQIKPDEHYVKRMVGMPGDTLSIQTPHLLINGRVENEQPAIARVASQANGYDGYQVGGRDSRMADYLARCSNNVVLNSDQYFACGDNQLNSLDSRYWGPVPRENLVGPAFLIYWPFSRHWGLAR